MMKSLLFCLLISACFGMIFAGSHCLYDFKIDDVVQINQNNHWINCNVPNTWECQGTFNKTLASSFVVKTLYGCNYYQLKLKDSQDLCLNVWGGKNKMGLWWCSSSPDSNFLFNSKMETPSGSYTCWKGENIQLTLDLTILGPPKDCRYWKFIKTNSSLLTI